MNERKLLWTPCIFDIVDDEVWFVSYENSLLVKYELKKDKATLVKCIGLDEDLARISGSIYNTVRIKDKVFMIPGFASKIYVYNICKKEIFTIDVPKQRSQGENYYLHQLYDKWLYIFPYYNNVVLKINTDNCSSEIIRLPFLNNCCFTDKDCFDNKVYLVNMSNMIYEFDLLKDELNKHSLDRDISIETISIIEKHIFILTDKYGKTYIYDMSNKNIKVVRDYGIEFYSSCYIEGSIILIPFWEEGYIVRMKVGSYESDKVAIPKCYNYLKWPHNVLSVPFLYKNILYMFNTQNRSLIKYNVNNGNFENDSIIITIGESETQEVIKTMMNENKIIDENMFGLTDYLCSLIDY